MGHADDGLRREVEHRVDIVLVDGALDGAVILDRAPHDVDLVGQAVEVEGRARHLIAHQTHHPGAPLHQGAGEPPAQEAGAAGDEDAPLFPETHREVSRTCQGTPPSASSSSNSMMSL